MQEFNSIADLQAWNIDNPNFAAHVGAYYCVSPCTTLIPDGGEGLFVPNGHCGQQTDHGSIIVDMKSTCWYRQNINGDLRQFGVTLNQQYDCSKTRIDTCAAADTILAAAQAAAEGAGVHRLTTSGVQIRLASTSTFALDPDMTLDGGVRSPGVSNHNITNPGTIWTGDLALGQPAIALGAGAVLQNGAVMPYWLGKYMYDQTHMPPGSDHLTVPQQEYILSQMVALGQEGVKCGDVGCKIRNAAVAGYDTAIEVTGGQGATLEDVEADGDVCVYAHGITSSTHWGRMRCNVSATSDGPSDEHFTITGVDDDGSGNCLLTLDAASDLTDVSTNYYVWVSGLDATTGANANGRWKPLSVDNTLKQVVLKNSKCIAGSGVLRSRTVTASYTAGTRTIRLAPGTQADKIAVGQAVTGGVGTDIPPNTVVNAVARTMSCYASTTPCVIIGVSNTLPVGHSSVSVMFTSTNAGFSGAPCVINGTPGQDSTGPCLIMTAQERIDGGMSAGGVAAGGTGCGTAFLIGGFANIGDGNCNTGNPDSDAEKISGFDAEAPMCYAYAICYHLANAYNARLFSAGMDATRKLSDEDTLFGLVDGGFKGVSFIGGKAGKTGAGLIINPSGTDKGCVTVESQNLSDYELDQGCLLAHALDSANTLFVSDNGLAAQMTGNSPNLNIYKQDSTPANLASSITDTSGILAQFGATWWGGQFTPGGFPPCVTMSGGNCTAYASGNDSVGRFALPSGGTSFAVTFSHSWANAPVCRAEDESTTPATALSATASASTLTIMGTLTSGHNVAYTCEGYSN